MPVEPAEMEHAMGATVRDKSAKFVDLANKRVNKALKDLRLIANLANRKNYEYSEDQARKIMKALQKEIDNLKVAFQSAAIEGQDEFKL